jgi:outer membrane receptor protein involved in Fe transport
MKSKTLQILIVLLLTTLSVVAQTGTIRGTIKDAKTKEDLIGTTIKIDGTTLGASTDINGFFTINKVKTGKVTLKITYVSYKEKVIDNIEIKDGIVTEINTFLEEDKALLNEVKVVASRMTNTEISLISEIKAAQMVVNGISAQQIAKTLDKDAAQVVRRIPGVTIVGDRFINVRGLNQRYNNVMLHNAFTPSMETDVKSFSFDVIPSSQIDRILIYKSPSAELPGDFAGGLIKIFTKGIPDNNNLVIEYSTAYRENTSTQDFYAAKQSKNYWTGFNTGYYNLPKFFPNRITDIANNPAALESAGRQLRNEWVAQKSSADLDQRISLTGNYKFNLGNIKIGNITALNYSNSRTNFGVARNDFNANINNQPSPIYSFYDQQYSQNIRVGIMHNWAFRFNDNHTVEIKNLFNQLSNGNYIRRTGRAIEANYNPDNHSFNQVYRGIYTGQLIGKHSFKNGKILIDWVGGYNNSYREQPDYRRYRSDVETINSESSPRALYVPVGTASAFFLGRWFSEMKENTYTGGVNFTQKLVLKNQKDLEIKAGFFFEEKARVFNGRNLGYVRGSGFDANLFNGSITNLFNNINNSSGIRIDEQTNPNDSYTAGNTHLAGYGMVSVPLTKKFNAIVGLRIEDNTQRLESAFLGGTKASVKNPVTSVLPSANFSYNFSDKMLVRAAYGKTINRPEFRELAPFSFYDFDFNVVYEGYTGLKVSTVDNLDVRWEFYPTPSESISIAAFYKKFKNPIEIEVEAGSGSLGAKTFVYQNADNARSTGVELEIKKGLAGLTTSPFLDKFSILFNAALIYSRVKLREGAEGQSDNRPLQGQSPYIINAGINYNNQKGNLQVNLVYNVIGKRIFAVGFLGYPDLYEMPRNVIDFSFSKGIGQKIQIKGGIQDILNQSVMILQDGNQDGKFESSKDEVMQSYKPGRLVSLGLSYQIGK